MKKLLYVVLLAVLLASCATIPTRIQVSDGSDRDFIRSIWEDSLEFSIPEGKAAELAWDRAHVYVAQFGAPIAHAYKLSITTINPQFYSGPGKTASIAYVVTRLNENGRDYFTIQAFAWGDTLADRLGARMLSRYMRTGEIRKHLINLDLDVGSIIGRY